MHSLYFRELDAWFDPARARLSLPGLSRPPAIVAGVETGQLAGIFGSLEATGKFAVDCGAKSLMISNYLWNADGHGEHGRIVLRGPNEMRERLAALGVTACTVSAHCAAYAHLSAKWGVEYAEKFVPVDVLAKGARYVEDWSEDYLLVLLETGVGAGIRIYGWFWGLWGPPALHSGYPWPFGWDRLMGEGLERFRSKTARIRKRANELGAYLAHEIHPGTGALCARDFGLLLMAADYDPCLCVWGDPSHCWAGESWEERFTSPFVAPRVVGSHIKNFKRRAGASALMISEDWRERGHQFCGHGEGEVNLESYAKTLLAIGAAERFCAINKCDVFPLFSEAEDSILPLTAPSPGLTGACAAGIQWVNTRLAGMSAATALFTDAMARRNVKHNASASTARGIRARRKGNV